MGKKKGKKGKEAAVIPGGLTEVEEADRKAKAKRAFAYFKEAQKEERDFNEYQQQREKLNYFWIVEKKCLEDKKAELRNKERELQDLEEKHAVEVKIYKQRVKHLLYEHQDEVTQQKTQGEELLSQTQTAHRLDEAELKGDRRALRLQKQEDELSHDAFLNSLKATHDRAVHDLRKEFARKGTEVQKQYETKTKTVREALEEERKKDCGAIERQKNVHIEQLMASHEKAFAEIKKYYNDITHNNLDLIKSLKEEVADVRRKEIQDEKAMEAVARENRRMSEPFKKAKQDVATLTKELEAYDGEKTLLRSAKARLLVAENRLNSLKWEDEVLRQKHAEVASQRDVLKDKHRELVSEVKQKANFKHLLLEKKLDAVAEQLEARDAQLDDALSRANVDVSRLSKEAAAQRARAKDIIGRKDSELASLRDDTQRVTEAHQALVEAVAQKMGDLGVPTAELGFAPLQTSMLQTSVFQQTRAPSLRRGATGPPQLPVQTMALEVSARTMASPQQVGVQMAV